jgi:hypothetical protein
MALTTEEAAYKAELLAARSKILSGKWLEESSVGGQDRKFADAPSLAHINRELSILNTKENDTTGSRRGVVTVRSDTW